MLCTDTKELRPLGMDGAATGALMGVVLTNTGSVIGGSEYAVCATIIVCSLFGAVVTPSCWMGGLRGLMGGVLLTAWGNLIGGSWLASVMFVSCCVLVGACRDYQRYAATRASTVSTSRDQVRHGVTWMRSWREWLLAPHDCGEWVYSRSRYAPRPSQEDPPENGLP